MRYKWTSHCAGMPDESSLSDGAAGALRVVEAIGYDRDKQSMRQKIQYLKII